MNWKLVSGLSLFGLAMGFATTYFLSTKVEAFCWLPIFIISSWFIARYAERKYFLHGFITNMLNYLWVTIIHVILSVPYLAYHPTEAAAYAQIAQQGVPIVTGIIISDAMMGLFSSIVLGAFASIAARIMPR